MIRVLILQKKRFWSFEVLLNELLEEWVVKHRKECYYVIIKIAQKFSELKNMSQKISLAWWRKKANIKPHCYEILVT
jgi:hypothetical protein